MGNCIKWENVEGSLQCNILNGTSPITHPKIRGEKLNGLDGTPAMPPAMCFGFSSSAPAPRPDARANTGCSSRAHSYAFGCASVASSATERGGHKCRRGRFLGHFSNPKAVNTVNVALPLALTRLSILRISQIPRLAWHD